MSNFECNLMFDWSIAVAWVIISSIIPHVWFCISMIIKRKQDVAQDVPRTSTYLSEYCFYVDTFR